MKTRQHARPLVEPLSNTRRHQSKNIGLFLQPAFTFDEIIVTKKRKSRVEQTSSSGCFSETVHFWDVGLAPSALWQPRYVPCCGRLSPSCLWAPPSYPGRCPARMAGRLLAQTALVGGRISGPQLQVRRDLPSVIELCSCDPRRQLAVRDLSASTMQRIPPPGCHSITRATAVPVRVRRRCRLPGGLPANFFGQRPQAWPGAGWRPTRPPRSTTAEQAPPPPGRAVPPANWAPGSHPPAAGLRRRSGPGPRAPTTRILAARQPVRRRRPPRSDG